MEALAFLILGIFLFLLVMSVARLIRKKAKK